MHKFKFCNKQVTNLNRTAAGLRFKHLARPNIARLTLDGRAGTNNASARRPTIWEMLVDTSESYSLREAR